MEINYSAILADANRNILHVHEHVAGLALNDLDDTHEVIVGDFSELLDHANSELFGIPMR